MINFFINAILLTTLILLSTGCSTQVKKIQTYVGPELPLEKTSILKCSPNIRIISVNGNTSHFIEAESGKYFTGCEIGLLPGVQQINLCFEFNASCSDGGGSIFEAMNIKTPNLSIVTAYKNAQNTSVQCIEKTLNFTAQAGRVYRTVTDQGAADRASGCQSISSNAIPVVSIIDSTNEDRNGVYLSKATRQAKLAKSAQHNNDWSEAVKYWKQTLDYAEKSALAADKMAKIHLRYGRALAVTCAFNAAEAELLQSYQIYSKDNKPTYTTLLSLARSNVAHESWPKALEFYEKALLENNDYLLENDTSLHEEIQNEYRLAKENSLSQPASSKYFIDSETPYGRYCS